MSEESGQVKQPAVGINPFPIPAQQGTNGKGMA